MESERLKHLYELANQYENRLEVMTDKTSKDYGIMMSDYQNIMLMIKQETERLNSVEKTKQEAERLELERDKLESNAQNERLRATIEDDKIRSQRKMTWLQIIGGCVSGLIVAAGYGVINCVTMNEAVNLNDGGKMFTKFQEKFIFPLRFK